MANFVENLRTFERKISWHKMRLWKKMTNIRYVLDNAGKLGNTGTPLKSQYNWIKIQLFRVFYT